jgi:hypothetical protein
MERNPKVDLKNAKALVEGMGIAKQSKEAELEEAEAAMAVVTA